MAGQGTPAGPPDFALVLAEDFPEAEVQGACLPESLIDTPVVGTLAATSAGEEAPRCQARLYWRSGQGHSHAFLVEDDSLPSFGLTGDDLASLVLDPTPLAILSIGTANFPHRGLADRLAAVFEDVTHVGLVSLRTEGTQVFLKAAGETQSQVLEHGAAGLVMPRDEAVAVGERPAPESEEPPPLEQDRSRLDFLRGTLVGDSHIGAVLDPLTTEELFLPSVQVGDQPGTPRAHGTGTELVVPLFPGVAIFPNAAIDLRIFEPRYRLLMKRSLDSAGVFGVMQSQSSVGCLCHVSHVSWIDNEGFSRIKATGLQRFKVLDGPRPASPDHDPLGNLLELQYGRVQILEDKPLGELERASVEVLRHRLSRRLNNPALRQMPSDPDVFPYHLATWLLAVPTIPPGEKLKWQLQDNALDLITAIDAFVSGRSLTS